MTGPNLYFGDCGAVLDSDLATLEECQQWAELVRSMCAHLGWPNGPLVIRRHATGAALAFAAPKDQLFTATEVNEWAWEKVSAARLDLPLPQAPGYPAVWDDEASRDTLERMAIAERNPAFFAVFCAAAEHHLPVFQDDNELTIGAGEGSMTWPQSPPLADIDWLQLHDIPTALVTGSNGKTTTVRLLAAMCRQAGWLAGFNCTDGVFIGAEQTLTGDYSGPAGARHVLRDKRVQAAILETARGGILRRGLAVRRADAAIVTNVSPDHFGEYGVHDLSDLADAKLSVAHAIGADGLLVLNADDPVLLEKSASLTCPLAWFSLEHDHPTLVAHRAIGGSTCSVSGVDLILHHRGVERSLGDVRAMPLTVSGIARYNISNLAGACLLAAALDIPPQVIGAVVTSFGRLRSDNPGRLERWQFAGVTVLLDYAHNPEGLAGLLQVAEQARAYQGGRLGLLLGQAGNRDNDAIRSLAVVAASAGLERIVLKDLDGYLRGRAPGEVPQILHDELLRLGVAADIITTVLPEVLAAQSLLAWSQPGDVLVLPVHNLAARGQLEDWLDSQHDQAKLLA